MSEIRVRPATFRDRHTVVDTLVRAFDADPVVNFLLRQDRKRRWAFETFFDVAFRRLILPVQGAWLTEGGAALWTPPGEWKSWRTWPDMFRLMRTFDGSRRRDVFAGSAQVQRAHPRAPHWYLYAMGVEPSRQGQGIGSALLRAMLERCDTHGHAAYLEASTESNARLYARNGFRTTRDLDLSARGPSLRLMWREPISNHRKSYSHL